MEITPEITPEKLEEVKKDFAELLKKHEVRLIPTINVVPDLQYAVPVNSETKEEKKK